MFETLKNIMHLSGSASDSAVLPVVPSFKHERTGDKKLDRLLKDEFLSASMKEIMAEYRGLYARQREKEGGCPIVGRYHHHRVIAVNEVLLHAATIKADVSILTGNSDALAANKETFAHLRSLSESLKVKLVLVEAHEGSLWRRIADALPKIEVYEVNFKSQEEKPSIVNFILIGDRSYLVTAKTENIRPEDPVVNHSSEIPVRVNFNEPERVKVWADHFNRII